MLPRWMRDRVAMRRVELPPDHPWHAGVPEFTGAGLIRERQAGRALTPSASSVAFAFVGVRGRVMLPSRGIACKRSEPRASRPPSLLPQAAANGTVVHGQSEGN
jgi:hypothetical protein